MRKKKPDTRLGKELLESETKSRLKKFLDSVGVYWFMPVQGGYGASSVDFLCCWKGEFHAIETKRQGVSTPTPRQRNVMAKMRKSGASTWLVTLDTAGELKWIKQDDACN